MVARRNWGGVLTCLLLLPSAAAWGDEPAKPIDGARLEGLHQRFQTGLDAIVKKYELPGITAAYALSDGQVVALASGVADKDSGAAMTVDAGMLAGSIGKTMAAATVIALAQDGKLSLDDKVSKWMGDEPWYADLPDAAELTIRHLLMHRGGLADHVYDPQWQKQARRLVNSLDTDPDDYFNPRQLVEFIVGRKPKFAAGQGYAYTDTGYILLGMVIERAGDAPYYEQARRRFLEPLKLTRTGPADRRTLPNLVAGYVSLKNPFGLPEKIATDGTMCYNPAGEWTGGGFVSNPQDLVQWAKALYEGRAMEKPYLDELLSTDPADKNKRRRYGLGVFISDGELGTSYGHGGWCPGYLSHMEYYPAQRVAVAMQVNSDVRDDMLGDLMALVQDVLQTVGPAP